MNICTSVFRGFGGLRGTCFNKLLLDRDQLIFSANIFNLNNEVYAIQTRMDHKNLSFGVLMLADREKCERFKVTLEIQDSNFQTGFLAHINPAPVDTKNSDVTSLVVPKQNFAKMVTIDGDTVRYVWGGIRRYREIRGEIRGEVGRTGF